MKVINANFPPKLSPLFLPYRYKVIFGGRGGGRSWGCARALLIQGLEKPLRILCAREIQKSIKDSVLKLLSDQIKLLGMESYYEVYDTVIRGANGTEFTFSGLAQHTVDSVKSMEGVDIVWCEEAHRISTRSWDILIPTIRKDDSEIWITFNPDLETDPTYQRFVIHPPANTVKIELSYSDNPYFNEVLDKERLHCKETDPDNYKNIWEGRCRPAVEGAIYYKQIEEAEQQGRICNVPYDPMLKTHIVMDLGWSDSLAAGLVQKNLSEIRIIEYLEASHTKLDIFSAELKQRPYNWGKMWLPHDGHSGQLNSGGKSTADILRALGWKVPRRDETNEVSIEEGIRQTRLLFPQIYFDRTKCHTPAVTAGLVNGFNQTDLNHDLIECLKRYRRHINKQTLAEAAPVKDNFTHGADMLRYIGVNADLMSNEIEARPTYYAPSTAPLDNVIGY